MSESAGARSSPNRKVASDAVSSRPPIGVLVMAYGTASGPNDVERYYADILGGRPPSAEHLRELEQRYEAIGNRFPLLEITRRQAEGLVEALNRVGIDATFHAYLGMKHSPPFIADTIARMRDDGIERALGVVMAPHWSAMSIETYVERVNRAVADGGGPSFTFVRQWHDHPGFVSFLAQRVDDALSRLTPDERARVAVVFSAHSLPQREIEDGTKRCLTCFSCPEGCRYAAQLSETAELVAQRLGLRSVATAWQSAGRSTHAWLGPPLEDVIPQLALAGHSAVVVCSAGFVADHLEILYDLDIEARRVAKDAGIAFVRTEMPNADPKFLEVLAAVVTEHLAAARARA